MFRAFVRLRQGHWLVPHRQLGLPQEYHRQGELPGEAGQRRHQRHYANGRKDDWNSHLTLAEFAIN